MALAPVTAAVCLLPVCLDGIRWSQHPLSTASALVTASLPNTVLKSWITQRAAGSLPSGWGANGGLGALQQLLIEDNQLDGSLPSQWGKSGEHAAASVFTPNEQHAGFSKTLLLEQGRQRHLGIRPLCGNLQSLHLVWCDVRWNSCLTEHICKRNEYPFTQGNLAA